MKKIIIEIYNINSDHSDQDLKEEIIAMLKETPTKRIFNGVNLGGEICDIKITTEG